MVKDLKRGFLMMVVMTVLTGFVYPAVVTVIGQVLFRDQANGSLMTRDGHVIGSRLIGQGFSKPEYFHPRPSSAGAGYDATASAGSNLGSTNAKLINGSIRIDDKKNEVVDFDGVKLRVLHYCIENGLPFDLSVPIDQYKDAKGQLDDVRLIKAFGDEKAPLRVRSLVPIPPDAVMGSASGLDPDISPMNADLQAARVAKVRGMPVEQVKALVTEHTTGRSLGFLGEPRVNVLELNLSLEERVAHK
jgi:potassium-transporting ATPase KdpC subunit